MRDPRLARTQQPEPQPALLAAVREAARELALGPPEVGALENAVRDIHLGWDTFYDTFSSQVLADKDRCHAWVAALRSAIRDVTTDVSKLASEFDAGRVAAEIETWKRERDALAIWKFADSVTACPDVAELEFHVLPMLDQQAWIEEIDALSMPSLMWNVAWSSPIEEDPDLVERLLFCAPPLFNAVGAWTRSVTAPICVRLIQTYAERVLQALGATMYGSLKGSAQWAAAERAVKDFAENELPSRLRRFYGSLLTRPDGRYLAHGLLADLAPHGLSAHQAMPRHSWVAAAFESLVTVLAASGTSVEELRSSWQERNSREAQEHEAGIATPLLRRRSQGRIDARKGEGRQVFYAKGFPLLLGASAILTHTGIPEPEAGCLWSWFSELLMGRDPGLNLALSDAARAEITKRLGALLSKLPDHAAAWRAVYRALEPQRRRGQSAIRYDDDSHKDTESVLLVHVGLCACDHAIETAGDAETRTHQREFFWSLYEAARRLWLTAAMDIGGRKRELVASCFAFMPAVFGDALGKALARALRPIGNDPWLFARACSYLRLNGIDAARMKQLLADAGMDLEATLRDAREWSMLTGQKGEFPQEFQQLADALGYKYDFSASLSASSPSSPPSSI